MSLLSLAIMAKKIYAKRAELYGLYEAARKESKGSLISLEHGTVNLEFDDGAWDSRPSTHLKLKTKDCGLDKYKPYLFKYLSYTDIWDLHIHPKYHDNENFAVQADDVHSYLIAKLLDQFSGEEANSVPHKNKYDQVLTLVEKVRKIKGPQNISILSYHEKNVSRCFTYSEISGIASYFQKQNDPFTKDDFKVLEGLLSSQYNFNLHNTEWVITDSDKRIILPRASRASIHKLKETVSKINKKKRWWQF